ncbi:hypothetical protein JM946_16045 [Steroidobacter sp. S1-65]|uniref:Uncharacterized protein n=1 Tax=Steroidobacter gossypii TaxID=2805490 RepID=A0ABS1WZ49_9GAMM|nr:hypothetical protein [Steroidobacter gossypii]MBM0106245.1 hypothetical protein [Steroidobacter gossypii]
MPQEFSRLVRLFIAFTGLAALAACGGGGGGSLGSDDGNNPPPGSSGPTVTLDASSRSIATGQTVTLTWSSTNATSCTASGGWTGAKATSGSEVTAALSANTNFTLTCTGDGGSRSASVSVVIVPAPTVTFSAAQSALIANYSTTLSWNAANATSCTASNDGGGTFTGDRPAVGADATGPVSATTTYTLTCTGVGGTTSQSVTVTASAPPAGQVVLFGRVTFDRLPFSSVLEQGLNASQPVISPAREVVVQVTGGFSASTVTDAGGYYAVTVPAATSVQVAVRAQMQKSGTAPTWNFRVLNNANSDALYVLQGSSGVPVENTPRNLHAPSGWGGTSYTAPRAAAPFAILDTVYNSKQMILGASPNAQFADLNLYWSTSNRTTINNFCPDNGDIGTSFYFRDPSGNTFDDCGQPLPEGIYILGDYAGGSGDTDEFDAHVIAHEFGHYFEDRFSRSDSLGGEHGSGDQLDMRVAFGEGWGNAFGAMSLRDPQYRDSFNGISDDFGFNLEADSGNDGWFSEASVGEILWDIFDDSPAESRDDVALGFGPIFEVMTDEQVSTEALTSIFSFASALRSANGSASGEIASLLDDENINGDGAFGAGETNGGGDTRFTEIYTSIAVGAPVTGLCSTSNASGNVDGNKLGNRRFLRFTKNTTGLVTIVANGVASGAGTQAAVDPDILVHSRGQVLSFGTNGNGEPIGQSSANGQETISQVQLPAGTYVIEVYAYEVIDPNQSVATPRCMSVSISGTN